MNCLDLFEKKIKPLAEKEGVEVRRCSEYHFQLKSIFLVNVYPTKATFYVQGTNHKLRYYDLNQLIEVSKGNKDLETDRAKKKRRTKARSRNRMWEESKICFYCGYEIAAIEDASIEHKVPLSRGGSNRRDNLALSHKACNRTRGNSLSVKRKELSHDQAITKNL